MSQLRIPCLHCNKIISYSANHAGKRVLCPSCKKEQRLPQLEVPNKQPCDPDVIPEIVTNRGSQGTSTYLAGQAQSSRAALHRYIDWAGKRSVIFQSVLLAWTVFWVILAMFIILSSSSATSGRHRDESDTAALGIALMCPLSMWALLAIPLGIAAIATLKERKPE